MKPAFAERRHKGDRLDRTVSVGARRCPIDGCAAPLKDGHLMCRAHWSMVPVALRAEVRDSWATYLRLVRADPFVAPGALVKYRLAVAGATAFVNGRVNARLTAPKGTDR